MNDFSLRNLLDFQLFSVAGASIHVATLLLAALLAALSYFFARLLERATVRSMTRAGAREEGSVAATARLVYYVAFAVGLAISIHSLGINLSALFAAGAFFAVALGFAMQNITQNFVSGVILLVERTIKPGDVIEVEGRVVRVTSLGMRATVARTWDSEDYIIPNSVLVTGTVKNLTLRDRLHRVRCPVGVSYASDMVQVRQVLEDTLRDLPWREKSTAPVVQMTQFGSSSVDFDVSIWITDPFARSTAKSQLNEAVWFGLKNANIEIAFPQLDIHVKQLPEQPAPIAYDA